MSYQPYSSGAGLEVFLVAAVFGDDQGGEPQFLFDFGSFPSAGYGAMFQSRRFKAYASGLGSAHASGYRRESLSLGALNWLEAPKSLRTMQPTTTSCTCTECGELSWKPWKAPGEAPG